MTARDLLGEPRWRPAMLRGMLRRAMRQCGVGSFTGETGGEATIIDFVVYYFARYIYTYTYIIYLYEDIHAQAHVYIYNIIRHIHVCAGIS